MSKYINPIIGSNSAKTTTIEMNAIMKPISLLSFGGLLGIEAGGI
jgi:hypothetical protein